MTNESGSESESESETGIRIRTGAEDVIAFALVMN
jgi:hypothetical protein